MYFILFLYYITNYIRYRRYFRIKFLEYHKSGIGEFDENSPFGILFVIICFPYVLHSFSHEIFTIATYSYVIVLHWIFEAILYKLDKSPVRLANPGCRTNRTGDHMVSNYN